jgi:hypothetical protein
MIVQRDQTCSSLFVSACAGLAADLIMLFKFLPSGVVASWDGYTLSGSDQLGPPPSMTGGGVGHFMSDRWHAYC